METAQDLGDSGTPYLICHFEGPIPTPFMKFSTMPSIVPYQIWLFWRDKQMFTFFCRHPYRYMPPPMTDIHIIFLIRLWLLIDSLSAMRTNPLDVSASKVIYPHHTTVLWGDQAYKPSKQSLVNGFSPYGGSQSVWRGRNQCLFNVGLSGWRSVFTQTLNVVLQSRHPGHSLYVH